MKKIILFISLLVFPIISVFAKENKLYFTESDERIYYESKLFDEDVFMKHTDMIPGKSYQDELLIENGTDTEYTLYFKVLPKEQSAAADELLENILMKITVDGEVLYDGVATGVDYTDKGIDLRKAISLGKFSKDKKAKVLVETKLSEEYDNTEFNEFSYINWAFYAQYGDSEPPIQIIESPDTMKNSFPYLSIISFCIILIGIGFMVHAVRKKN